MYHKILAPLDGSKEAEKVLNLIKDEVAPDGTIVLLQVIPSAKTLKSDSHIILGSQQEAADRYEAMGYLKAIARQQGGDSNRWRCEVAVSSSISDGIVNFARRENADLIAMYTHDHELLTRRVKRSIAREVQRKTSIEVRVFDTSKLEEPTPEERESNGKSDLATHLFKRVDIFSDLSDQQIQKVVALGQRLQVTTGEMLGIGGELGQDLFVILEGEAHLTTHSDVGEILVRIARPGDAFPLAALLGAGTLITSGEALTDMELLKIPRSELLALCSRDTDLGMRIYAATDRLFANRYAETLAHLAVSAERELREAPAYR
jgi:CRP-like cAMP-binding protein/nucleotide-binding universal stress UspA family protein